MDATRETALGEGLTPKLERTGDCRPPREASANATSHAAKICVAPLHAAAGRSRLSVAGLKAAPDRAALLEHGLSNIPGIRSVSASILTGNVTVYHEPPIAVSAISEWISALLYGDTTPADEALQTAWHTETADAVARALHSDAESGLTPQEVITRLAAGANTLPPPRRRSSWSIFAGQFESLPVLMLVGAGAISVFTGAFLEAAAIAGVVALNGAIGFRTESETERTIESLGLPEALSAQAVRDGIAGTVQAEELVPGDLIVLRRGMIVPADARLVTSRDLTISEAALTGESLPVAKTTGLLARLDTPLADRTNMVYRGTAVTGGSGTAIVVATGGRTEVGRIQHLVGAVAAPATPLQRSLENLGRRLVWMTLAAGALIFGIGLLRGFSPLQILRLALATAVAAVPEGLPMVATSTLALGVGALRRRNVLVRRLDAIETLAAADVICFDKTGTLTLGSMSVDAIAVAGRTYRRQALHFRDQDGNSADPSDERINRLLAIGGLCSQASLERREEKLAPVGSPTEAALLQAALDVGLDVQGLRRDFPLRTIQHRTEAYRFMATVHSSAGATLIAVKGNPAEVLARCSHELLQGGHSQVLTFHRRVAIENANSDMARGALRVLGFAYQHREREWDGDILVEDLTWVGLVGLADPVRPGLSDLMCGLHRAGLQTIMLTGDQSATARAVGERINLGGTDGHAPLQVVGAAEIDGMPEAARRSILRRTHAFARVSPAQKLAVVRDLQRAGAVVAMVGDGINDSPALRAADVGIALGQGGPAAAREVADIYLETDDLRVLLVAIERGRTTAANVRKSIHYLLSTNASEVLLMLVATAAGFSEALSPVQLLWINLISDVLPGIGLAMEPAEASALSAGPTRADASLVSPDQMFRLTKEAVLLAAGALAATLFGAARYGRNAAQTRTMAFGSLTAAQLLHTLNCRGVPDHTGSLARNPALGRILAGSCLAQGTAFLVPQIRRALGIAPIGVADAAVMLASAFGSYAAARTLASPRTNEALYFRRTQTSHDVTPQPSGASQTALEGGQVADQGSPR